MMLFSSAVIGTFFGADQWASWQAVRVNAFAAMLTSVLLLVPFGLHRPETAQPPKWSRIEWAQQLLIHIYTRTSPRTRSTSAHHHRLHQLVGRQWQQSHQFLQLALDTDAAYRLARLSDQMVGSGIVAGWNMNKEHRL